MVSDGSDTANGTVNKQKSKNNIQVEHPLSKMVGLKVFLASGCFSDFGLFTYIQRGILGMGHKSKYGIYVCFIYNLYLQHNSYV